jgi:hypothetical protein
VLQQLPAEEYAQTIGTGTHIHTVDMHTGTYQIPFINRRPEFQKLQDDVSVAVPSCDVHTAVPIVRVAIDCCTGVQ